MIKKFTTLLRKNPLPKRAPAIEKDAPNAEQVKVTIARHAAILGLGALVQAFPYASPPPTWIPTVLATLATKAAGDPGMVGKSAKGIVSDFKNTRQGTWHIDIKVCLGVGQLHYFMELYANTDTGFHTRPTRGSRRSIVEELFCLKLVSAALIDIVFSYKSKVAL